jgi:phage FluMu protein Com
MKHRAPSASVDRDLRCDCGRMVARIESRGIVIKCNRCGEFVVIDLSTLRELLKTYEAAL